VIAMARLNPNESAIVHLHKNECPDSVEVGSPSKGGVLKVYFDADDLGVQEESGQRRGVAEVFEGASADSPGAAIK
jgi:hypothetical protein